MTLNQNISQRTDIAPRREEEEKSLQREDSLKSVLEPDVSDDSVHVYFFLTSFTFQLSRPEPVFYYFIQYISAHPPPLADMIMC